MTSDEFAEALCSLIVDAEHNGLDAEKILAEIEDMAQAMRLCVAEWPPLLHPHPPGVPQRSYESAI